MNDVLRYGYAVCRPFDQPLPPDLTGVADADVEQVRHGDLVAITGTVPRRDFSEAALRAHLEDLDWLAATARAHDRVLAALTRVTSPLPLRLATVFRDADGVRAMLSARHDDLRLLLDRLDGRVEWGVKAYALAEDAPAGGAPATERARAASGRDYLARRRAERSGRERSWQRAQEFADSLQHDLARYAVDVRAHRPQDAKLSGVSGHNVLNVAYLVDRDRGEEFAAAVHRARDEAPDLRVDLTGPWAAYSFGDLPERAGGAAGAAGGVDEAGPGSAGAAGGGRDRTATTAAREAPTPAARRTGTDAR